MMSSMQTPPTDPLDLDVETFARPVQQRRFASAMEQLAASRRPDASARVFISAAPRTMNNPKWDSWLKQIEGELPGGVEILHYRNTFTDRPYDWSALAGELDGLVVVGKQKRPGSRVYLFGPIARLELRSLIAKKPVLLFGHNLGLIPAIDCKNQVLGPEDAPRLKLIAPKRWKRDSETLQAALHALGAAPTGGEGPRPATAHLAHPFATPPR
ncbi:hypothetical protein AB0K71_18035 [Streptomyces syringium]|uniref:hypothetical protein n=1 Tax=Streptomyces syringium TaxID=76729 RepID=UPI00343FDA54